MCTALIIHIPSARIRSRTRPSHRSSPTTFSAGFQTVDGDHERARKRPVWWSNGPEDPRRSDRVRVPFGHQFSVKPSCRSPCFRFFCWPGPKATGSSHTGKKARGFGAGLRWALNAATPSSPSSFRY